MKMSSAGVFLFLLLGSVYLSTVSIFLFIIGFFKFSIHDSVKNFKKLTQTYS